MFENLPGSSIVTVVFMAIVFAFLVAFILYIMLQSKLFNKISTDRSKEVADTIAVSLDDDIAGYRGLGKLKPNSPMNEDEAIIAAIIASICTYSGLSVEQFKIRSVKMIENDSNWRKQSLL